MNGQQQCFCITVICIAVILIVLIAEAYTGACAGV
jgi:hypothetical protein